jgi:hypothetical protein
MKKPDRKLSRLAVGAGGAAATVALVSKEQEQNASGSAKTETSQGYRLTEHVQNYYRTAKV